MIINSLEDVRFTLGEGAWIDDGPLRQDADAVRVKLRLARLRFAIERPPYNDADSPALLALQNGGRFPVSEDGIEEVLFHTNIGRGYNDYSGTDWSKEHPLVVTFTTAELVLLGSRAVRDYYVKKVLYHESPDTDIEQFRQELHDLADHPDTPPGGKFKELAADIEAMQEINDGVNEIIERERMDDMVTAGFIARTVRDFLRT